jgi:alanine racemase
VTLTLHVDAERWRSQHKRVIDSYPGLVPVAKGNGYGFGVEQLATEAAGFGADLLAVGTYDELAVAKDVFPGDLLVLTPYRPFLRAPADEPRMIHTVSRLADLQILADGPSGPDGKRPRVVIELFSTMRRFGVPADDLPAVVDLLSGVRLEGWALHLPLPEAGAHSGEVEAWISRLSEAGTPAKTLFVSHLSAGEQGILARVYPDLRIRARIGTQLWLSDREAYHAKAHVLEVHPVRRGERFGYRQRRVPTDGHLVVVSGGTAHGIALEAPSHVANLRTRAKVLATSGLEAAGLALSPFYVGGQRRWFAEPPHMQVSVLFLPTSIQPPDVGDELDVNVGMTITRFDRTLIH